MTVYEYHCSNCKIDFEKEGKFGETQKTPKCPKCNSTKEVRKIISASSIIFKGEGFTKSLNAE